MAIRVTVGETVRQKIGAREKEIPFGNDRLGSKISLEELSRRLGIALSDPEGSLLVFVNGKMVASESYHATMIQDGDHVELMLPLSGG